MHDIYHNISFADIESQIDSLQLLDFQTTDIQDVRQLISRLITGFTNCDQLYTKYPINNIFRARINKPRSLYENIQELVYPDPCKITTCGRLNDIGSSVFYGACEFETAILETRPKEGDFVTVMRCQPKNKNNFGYMELGVVGNIIKDVQYTNTLNEHSQLKNKMVTNYFLDEMTKIVHQGLEYKYKASIAIGEKLLESRYGTLLYPSVIRLKNGINVATRTDVFDETINIVECKVFKITKKYCRLLYDAVNIDECESMNSNGDIAWSDKVKNVVLDQKSFDIEKDDRPMPNGLL
jgi:hypothetical protein